MFRDTLTQSGVISRLIRLFESQLEAKRLITHKGTIIDATFVDAPQQRNSRDENKQVKNGKTLEEWSKKPHKLAQKGTDARWTKKGNEVHYGYKDHTKVDANSKLITDYSVTPANVHDSNEFLELLGESDEVVYADSAYVGRELPEHIENNLRLCGLRLARSVEQMSIRSSRKAFPEVSSDPSKVLPKEIYL